MVLGSINLDLTSYLDRWPEIGETVTAVPTITFTPAGGTASLRAGAAEFSADPVGAPEKRDAISTPANLPTPMREEERLIGAPRLVAGPSAGM